MKIIWYHYLPASIFKQHSIKLSVSSNLSPNYNFMQWRSIWLRFICIGLSISHLTWLCRCCTHLETFQNNATWSRSLWMSFVRAMYSLMYIRRESWCMVPKGTQPKKCHAKNIFTYDSVHGNQPRLMIPLLNHLGVAFDQKCNDWTHLWTKFPYKLPWNNWHCPQWGVVQFSFLVYELSLLSN